MKTKRSVSSYVLLTGLTGLAIVAGIFVFQIFVSATKSQLTTEQMTLIKPIDGSIDEKVIEELRKRRVFSNLSLEPSPTISEINSNLTGNQSTEGGMMELAPTGATLTGTTP